MKSFMFIYEGGDPNWHATAPAEEMKALMANWEQWMQALAEKGQLVSGGEPLHFSGKRLDANGLVTDIAAAEFKDLVSGYSVVGAHSVSEAIEIAKTCPIFSDSSVKVQIREVIPME